LKDTTDSEATGLLLFDADNDDDLDLYVVSGGSEYYAHSHHFRDRFFRNDGSGNFIVDPGAIPDIFISGSIVTASDYDRDGDLDLFIGGRIIPQSYPLSERSILLQNNGGMFTDVTASSAKEFMNLGMVTAALWTDYDRDGWVDLMVAGDWMPIRMFRNKSGNFIEVSKELGLSQTEGWWNSIASGDFDKDGDIDYVLGNQGLNNRYRTSVDKPVYIIAKDFDNNGIIDPVMNAWMNGDYYPVHLRNDMIRQMQFLKTRFPRYIDYSNVKSDDLFTEDEMEGAFEFKARIFVSSLLIREVDGKFSRIGLPFEAQFAPVNGIQMGDFNYDSHPDLLMIGNNFNSESLNGAHDAFIGLFLRGNQEVRLIPEKVNNSGFFVDGDGRALVSLFDKNNNQIIAASQNEDSLKIFIVGNWGSEWIKLSPRQSDQSLRIYYIDGSIQAHELYYGSSYLSQSSRDLLINQSITEKITIIDYQGKTREILF
jgi:hypothetical protein